MCALSFGRGLLLLAMVSVSTAYAQTDAGQSSLKSSDLTEQNKTPGQDIDEVITNNKMRAESGSKSRWSISSDLSYNGGSIEKPLAEDRPNIAGATGTTDKASLVGSVATKVNLNSKHSLAAGIGLRWITPFAVNGPRNYNGDRFDADNPYLTYQYLYRWSGIQSVLQVTPTVYTNSNLKRLGYEAGVTVSQNNIYEVGTTGLSVGLFTAIQGSAYSKNGSVGQPGEEDYVANVQEEQSDYLFNIDPYLEYQLNDRFNLRAVGNIWNYEHIRAEKRADTFQWDKVFVSVGVGVSVTRDIFLYPNLQFLPDNVRSDLTNIALNANLNVF